MNSIPRCEHPRPDRMRKEWLSLNGEWEFEIDNTLSGEEKGFPLRSSLDKKIILPFCPESSLSGVGNTDFMNAVWYRRDISVPEEWRGKRIFLHIDASDYLTTVYVNGKKAGTHKGGYTPIRLDVTDLLRYEGDYVTVYAKDDLRSGRQPSGKQSERLNSWGCRYTRTTGIWQSVWLEACEKAHTVSYKVYPDIDAPGAALEIITSDDSMGGKLSVKAYYDGRPVGEASATVNAKAVYITLPLSEKHLWECGNGRLYDLVFTLEKEGKCDTLHGYFGLRTVCVARDGFYLNGKIVFGRFVLDQGYYPDGITTAPSDEALKADIENSLLCGFNGARLHQKVFEPRFLYHADKLGYMVWGEFGNWGLDHTNPENVYNILPEWLEVVERDFSHPSVIGWCPFNETWDLDGKPRDVRVVDLVYSATKAMDKTRPIIADSGSFPTSFCEIHDVHDYEQDPENLRKNYLESEIERGIVSDQLYRRYPARQKYKVGAPIFVSEWGGIKWLLDSDPTAWGYGADVKTEEEFFERLDGLASVLYGNKYIIGCCYTQLYDIELEKNGFMTYDRRFKFDPEKFRKIISKKAVLED